MTTPRLPATEASALADIQAESAGWTPYLVQGMRTVEYAAYSSQGSQSSSKE